MPSCTWPIDSNMAGDDVALIHQLRCSAACTVIGSTIAASPAVMAWRDQPTTVAAKAPAEEQDRDDLQPDIHAVDRVHHFLPALRLLLQRFQ